METGQLQAVLAATRDRVRRETTEQLTTEYNRLIRRFAQRLLDEDLTDSLDVLAKVASGEIELGRKTPPNE